MYPPKGRPQLKKNRFLLGIAQITSPPPPPNSGKFYNFWTSKTTFLRVLQNQVTFFSNFLGYFWAPQDQFWGTQLLQRVQTGQVGCPHTSFHNFSRYFKCFDPSESTIVAAGAWCRGASVGQKCTKNHNANWRLWGQNSPWI